MDGAGGYELGSKGGMKVGILGGAFDPPHMGHLILAQACLESADLEEIWWLPSAHSPHKPANLISSWEHRVSMVKLAIVGNASFRVETIESTLPGPNFTYQTLSALKAQHPDHQFHLILGEDSLVDLPQWREPKKVIEQAALVVYPRRGNSVWNEEEWRARLGLGAGERPELIRVSDVPLVDIASRDLRKRVSQGKSIRYQVPRAVEVYLRQNALYEPADS